MMSRRTALTGLVLTPAAGLAGPARGQASPQVVGEDLAFNQLTMPSIESLDDPELFGYAGPNEAQKAKAREMIDGTPKGPTPIAIAESFITRYAKSDPDLIAQWPSPAAWNPLVVEFFRATSLRVNNDMIDWCAAFVNWCIVRNNREGTDSAGSQSFVYSGRFKKTDKPKEGDIVVFTCYDNASGKSLGLGHVAFFKQDLGSERILVVAGNQSKDGHSSIISEASFSTKPFPTHRHVSGNLIPCTFKLNSYLSLA